MPDNSSDEEVFPFEDYAYDFVDFLGSALNTQMLPRLESAAKEQTGIVDIFNKGAGEKNGQVLHRYVPAYSNIPYINLDALGSMSRVNDKMPHAALIGSASDMQHLIQYIYNTMHCHYAYAIDMGMENANGITYSIFPSHCCEPSGINVAHSLILNGLAGAAYVVSDDYDHGYGLLPFSWKGKDPFDGVIVYDPTSDQMDTFEGSGKMPQNFLFIARGSTFRYRTGWCNRADLYPDGFFSIQHADSFLKYSGPLSDYFRPKYPQNVKYYIETAFEIPKAIALPNLKL